MLKALVLATAWFFCVALVLLRFWAPERFEQLQQRVVGASSHTPPDSPAPPPAPAETAQGCTARLPAHGQHLIPLNGSLDAGISLASELSFPVVVVFTDANGDEAAALTLYPGKNLHTRMMSGEFTMTLLGGQQWCDLATGFLDGFEKDAPQAITLQPGDMKGVRLSPMSDNPQDILFSFRNGMEGNGRVEGSGSLVLQPVVGGHFGVDGSINQKPIRFMLDTGATTVSVNREFAVHAGLDTANCRKQQYETANGIITACNTIARELTLGHFRMTGVEVSIQDNLKTPPLLGMNVIGRFRMEMRNGAMVLSAY
jgi:clan AA aspartic protease (TIGR02281 family)